MVQIRPKRILGTLLAALSLGAALILLLILGIKYWGWHFGG